MGIQSTIEITRETAENKWIENKLKEKENKLKYKVSKLSNEELENYLDETFYNYTITNNPNNYE